MGDRRIKTSYQNVETEVELWFSDIMECVYDLNRDELTEVYDEVCDMLGVRNLLKEKPTLNDNMKEEWWGYASKKYTLEQLEEKLGNKYDLM